MPGSLGYPLQIHPVLISFPDCVLIPLAAQILHLFIFVLSVNQIMLSTGGLHKGFSNLGICNSKVTNLACRSGTHLFLLTFCRAYGKLAHTASTA